MNIIKTEDAEGHILCHDITQIIKGVTKDAKFRKGHIVKKEDIPILLSLGKDSLYVWEKDETKYHENEAAEILYKISAGENMKPSEVKEGKIEIIADIDGLLKIDLEKLKKINSLGEMIIATRATNFPVKKGDKLAGTRIIPLTIEKSKMEKALEAWENKAILELKKFRHKKVAIITTGNEVFYDRIKDTFTDVIIEKLKDYDVEIFEKILVEDNHEKITNRVLSVLEKGAEFVICTGGMSVDPDDKTPLAIKNTNAKIVSYGSPVLPGAMFLLSYYKGDIPIVGLPGCVMYSKKTIFDLVLPRLMADDKITSDDLASLGHGGLCLSCDICSFPNCGFGKGI